MVWRPGRWLYRVAASGRRAREGGVTLVEVLAAVALTGVVALACMYLATSVADLYRWSGAASSQLSETSLVFWELQRLAQIAQDVGTQPVTSGTGRFQQGPVSGLVPVLAMHVSNLQGIAPATSAVYQAALGHDYVCVAVVPVNGRNVLALFPGGDPYNPSASVYPPAADVYPLPDTGTDFFGTQFQIPSDSTFQVVISRKVQRVGTFAVPGSVQNSLAGMTFWFQIGRVSY
ncbi:MAG: prepilin-type N-terminal cleavage/methylation domain-containing protein [Alicyclobacillaceae bacterium]|nr:prepilin-type N-terminal cleavage/methylation domain-containing protein [Alicyclobacillaceae bacterium]